LGHVDGVQEEKSTQVVLNFIAVVARKFTSFATISRWWVIIVSVVLLLQSSQVSAVKRPRFHFLEFSDHAFTRTDHHNAWSPPEEDKRSAQDDSRHRFEDVVDDSEDQDKEDGLSDEWADGFLQGKSFDQAVEWLQLTV